MEGLLQQELVGKINKRIKRIKLFDFFWFFDIFNVSILNFFDFFDFFLFFWLIMSYFVEGQWKTDKDNRMSGHMTIIPFPVLY